MQAGFHGDHPPSIERLLNAKFADSNVSSKLISGYLLSYQVLFNALFFPDTLNGSRQKPGSDFAKTMFQIEKMYFIWLQRDCSIQVNIFKLFNMCLIGHKIIQYR